MRDGHECVVYDVNEAAIAQLEAEGAIGARSLEEFVAQARRRRARPGSWCPPAFAGDDGRRARRRCSSAATSSSTAATATTATTSTAPTALGRARHPLRRRRHERRRVRPRARLLPDDRRRGRRSSQHLDPIFRTLAPGVETAARTPGRARPRRTAEHGYLHCGRHGAGHFVKMVHNGIEYGLMAAYAEGLDDPQEGRHRPRASTPRTPRRRRCAIRSTTSTTSTWPRSPRSGGAAAWSARGCST